MSRVNYGSFLLGLFGFAISHSIAVTATHIAGLSAVTVQDQPSPISHHTRYYFRQLNIKNWVTPTNQSLFINGKLKDNSMFLVSTSGIYYVAANIRIKVNKERYGWYYWSTRISGKVYLVNLHDISVMSNMDISSSLQLKSTSKEKLNMKISGYLFLQAGWKVSIQITYTQRDITIKAGSTLSLLYISKPFAFPGIQIRSNTQYIELKYPKFSESLNMWMKPEQSSTMLSMAGRFVVPLNGLYHVIANIGVRRRTDVVYKFAIYVNNTVEVLSKTTSLSSQGLTTINLEGVLKLFKNEAISISISSNGQHANIRTYYKDSSLSICYKGKISHSHPTLSASFTDNNKRMPANTWNILSEWNLNAKPPLHFGNNNFLPDRFVSPKSGFYYVSLAISISDCDEAITKLNLKHGITGIVNSVGPGFHLTAENTTCNIDISLIIHLDINDTLRLSVLSDKTFTVDPTTTLQILYYNDQSHFWPAARFTLRNSVSFSNNKPPTKVTGWSPSVGSPGHPMFFTINKNNIEIRVPGLYIVACTLVLKRAPQFWGQFESQLTVNGKTTNDVKCLRVNTTSTFTCVMSTLLSLVEKDFLTVLIKTSDQSGSKKESMSLLSSSSVSVILVGDTRSRPSFRVAVCNKNTLYTTKAKTTSQKSCLPELSNTANTFFSSTGLYSLSNNSFETGSQKAFFIQSSMQFKLLSDGQVSLVIGSKGNNVYAYSQEQSKGLTSVLASAIMFDSPYNINISGQAFSSDFKWEIQPGSIVSGIYIGNGESTTVFQAVMPETLKPSANCSSEWRQIPHWTQLLGKGNPGTFTDHKSFQVSQDGLFFVSLNFVIITNVPGKDVQLGVFLDNTNVLFARETTRKGTNYINMLLQGVVTFHVNQVMEVRIKCSSSLNFTYSRYTLSGFRVDDNPTMPGIHWRLSPRYSSQFSARRFNPFRYNRYQRNNENYATDINYNTSTSEMSVSRSGIYFVSLTGELNDWEQSDFIFLIGNSSSTSCLHSSPMFFKKSNNFVRSVSTNGLVFLRKDEDFALIDLPIPGSYHKSYWFRGYHYHYYHYSSVYLSLHYIGDVEISSGISSILSSSKHLPKGAKLKLIDTNWVDKSMCGMFSTADVAVKFEKYKAVYSSIHMVTVSLMLTIKTKCHVTVCAVVTGRSKDLYQSCFEHHIANDTKNTSTVGGSVLLYLEKGEQVGIKVNNTCALTVSNRSTLSVIDLGRNSLFGFSAMIETAKANLNFVFPNLHYRYYNYRDSDTNTYDVQGWTTDAKNLKMAMFNRGIPPLLNEMFLCSKTGVYLILVKLHIKAVRKVLRQAHDCVVGAKLAVNSEDINIGVQQLFSGVTNTLSFTTTMMLKKWQAMTVQFTNKYEQCGEMEIGQGSTFAAIYLARPTGESYVMPSGTVPQIVQIPPHNVYIRVDKPSLISDLTCKAVGEFSIKYQWVNDNKKVINDHNTLDPRTLINSNNTRVACVVTMGTAVSQSSFILVTFFDPTPQFMETYSNMTYYIEERNATKYWYSSQTTLVSIAVGERVPGYTNNFWYWYWNNPISCFILNGDYDGVFHLAESYGYSYDYTKVYELNAQDDMIDYEKRTEYNLTISCINKKYKDTANVTTIVHVVVLDTNDNLPVFERAIYNITIPRNIRPGEDIIQVMATDDDFEQNGKIKYKLMETSNSFVIDSFSGVITLSSNGHGLTTKPLYILTVEATDQGIPPRSATAVVIVVIGKLRRTNNHPVFDKSEYTTSLIRLAPIGSLVQMVHAYDPDTLDEETVVYSIYNGDDKTFEINSRTGLITTKAKLSPKTYELQIAAEYSDKPLETPSHGQDRNITTVVILVEDVDITRPNFLKSHYTITVKENVEIKHLVLKIKAIDAYLPKNSHLNYSIPSPQEAFVIDSRSGEIRTAANLDYETRKHYVFVVSVNRAPDTLQSSCTDVTINVEDVNDNAPVILSAPGTIEVHENTLIGTIIGKVNATDADQGDNGKIKYYLLDSDYFHIDPDTGEITTRRMLDCCDVVYGLFVQVKDEGIPPQTVNIPIDIHVIPNGNHGYTTAGPRGHPKDLSSKNTIIIASSCAAVFILFFIFAAIYCKRRHKPRNWAATTMNYRNLPLDEDDEELLDPTVGDESERRLSLISQTSHVSAGSQDNLIPTEVQC